MGKEELERYELRINVEIRDARGYGNLSVSEMVHVSASTFLEIAGILGKFHELVQKLEEVKP